MPLRRFIISVPGDHRRPGHASVDVLDDHLELAGVGCGSTEYAVEAVNERDARRVVARLGYYGPINAVVEVDVDPTDEQGDISERAWVPCF